MTECTYSKQVARPILGEVKLSLPRGEWRLWMVKVARGKSPLAKARRWALAALAYGVWQERNASIFRGEAKPPKGVVKRIMAYSSHAIGGQLDLGEDGVD
ncbi:hypothetical protein Dimus_006167 [Dionaea muscipula]